MKRVARSDPIGVVGAGTMGRGIAQVAAAAGHPVLLFDDDGAARERAVEALGRDAPGARVRVVETIDDLADCALVVEAIVEDAAAKRGLFATLEKVVAPTAILASNTSSLSIDALADDLDHPERFLGLHFFNPAPRLPLVEVVPAARTAPDVADAAAELVTAWGKTTVRAASTPGFIVNRVARPFYAEGFRLLAAGAVDPATLDALLRESGGFRMGPCELTDLIGQDVNAAVTLSMWEAFDRDPRFEPSGLQQSLVDDGRLGRKSGLGWYDYRDDATPSEVSTRGNEPRAEPSSPASTLPASGTELRLTDGRTAAQRSAAAGHPVFLLDLALDPTTASRVGLAAPPQATPKQVDAVVGYLQGRGQHVTLLPDIPGLVVARTVAMLAAFAADAVDAGVATATDVDTAMRLGVNYPRGPYEWAEQLGWAWVVGVLDALSAAEDPQRYRVDSRLRARATSSTAQRAAMAMWAGDAASQALGMRLDAVGPGTATVSMRVRPDMVNGHGRCHGGIIFALADSAFAFACNSYNRTAVAQSCDITFVAAAREGDNLVAVATERHRRGRSGLYDVTVTRSAAADRPAEVVAEFRGRSRELPGRLFEADDQPTTEPTAEEP